MAVLGELGIALGDPTAEFWLGMTGQDNLNGLAMRAHRPALEPPRPVDTAFTDLVNSFEELLDRLLQRFEATYVSVFTRLDELLAVAEPAAAHITQLRNNVPQNQAALGYFFARAGAAWVTPLAAGGLFGSPPEPVLHQEEGTAELPFWPPSRFLVRVAGDMPAESVNAALIIPVTENSRVNSDLAELALQVPADQAVRLLSRVMTSLSSRFGVLLPERIGGLCRHLADGGQADAAMDLAGALLGSVPDRTGPRSGLDAWTYAEILREHMPAVTRAAGLPVLALLARTLDQAITAQTPARGAELRQDLSFSWMPTLDGHLAGTDTDPATPLVTAVRDAATQLLETGDATTAEAVAELESHDWPVFRRLAFFILCAHGHDATDLIAARLTDPAVIRDANLEREYLALERRWCGSIGDENQQRLLDLISQGPEEDEWASRSRYEEFSGEPPSAEVARGRVSRWQRDRLATAEAILPPEWRTRYDDLVAEFGQAADPASAPPMAVRDISFAGPVTAGELVAAPITAVIDLLQTWEPLANTLGPSRSSLASALGDAVQQDAAGRSAEADAFIGLPAVYVAAVISGLWRAVRERAILDWDAVLRLCSWADEQAVAELAVPPSPTRPQWRDARLNTLRLLEVGLQSAGNPVPITAQDLLWNVIDHAAADPDPLPDDEARWYESGQDPGGAAINHIRPQALMTAIACALWIRQHDANADLARFWGILDSHLDQQREPSRAVRWVYGRYFPWLVTLDHSWSAEHAAIIFPTSPAGGLGEAAWGGYIMQAPIAVETCAILDERYHVAVSELDPTATGRAAVARAFHLGRHLLILYWSGQLTFDSRNQMLRRFYQNAPTTARVDLMRFLGRSIQQSDISTAVAGRLTDLWEDRLLAVQGGADPGELSVFDEWFVAGKLGDDWELQQLLTALRLAGHIESAYQVLPRLASMAAAHIRECMEILQAWIETQPDPFSLQRQDASMRLILQAGLGSNDDALAEAATIIISLCIAKGFDLRDLLDDDQ